MCRDDFFLEYNRIGNGLHACLVMNWETANYRSLSDGGTEAQQLERDAPLPIGLFSIT